MSCRKCGGGGGQAAVQVGIGSAVDAASADAMILVEYVGIPTQFRSLRSKVMPARSYRYGGNPGSPERKFYIYAGDVEWLLGFPDFRRVPVPEMSVAVTQMPASLQAETRPAPMPVATLDMSSLPKEVVKALERAGYSTLDQIRSLSLSDLVSIKGMGPARARKVKDVLATYS